jgi:nucleoside-diphosphate-sugar epimerase
VQKRVPTTDKAKRILGYEAKTDLSTVLDEVIPWIREEIKHGRI